MLGLVIIVVIFVEMAPGGVLVGAILIVGWLLKPAPLFKTHGLGSHDEQLRVTDAGSSLLSAIPLLNAVYCVNCDLITNSPHDACGVCGSNSVVGVSRMWKPTLAEVPTNSARYKVSVIVDVREIPANGLNESIKLISRLAELGGDVKTIHIKVDPVFSSDATPSDAKTAVLKTVGRTATSAWQPVRRQASEYPTRRAIAASC
jgi:hypothetical protein